MEFQRAQLPELLMADVTAELFVRVVSLQGVDLQCVGGAEGALTLGTGVSGVVHHGLAVDTLHHSLSIGRDG